MSVPILGLTDYHIRQVSRSEQITGSGKRNSHLIWCRVPSRVRVYFCLPMRTQTLAELRFLFHCATASSVQGLQRYWGFTDHTQTPTLGRTPPEGWSSRRIDLTMHHTHKSQTPMPPAGFEPAIPASELDQTDALNLTFIAHMIESLWTHKYSTDASLTNLLIANICVLQVLPGLPFHKTWKYPSRSFVTTANLLLTIGLIIQFVIHFQLDRFGEVVNQGLWKHEYRLQREFDGTANCWHNVT
jgi:hypothetical protein